MRGRLPVTRLRILCVASVVASLVKGTNGICTYLKFTIEDEKSVENGKKKKVIFAPEPQAADQVHKCRTNH
jgi:hypothetical protein